MDGKYILAFDQGTTSSRAILFDKQGNIAAESQRPHEQIYPEAGWVSHNPREIFFNTVECAKQAMESAGVLPGDIAAIGVTNQRETLAAWDRLSGEPVCDAVVWQCRRTADICAAVEADGMGETVREKTGLLIDPYFSVNTDASAVCRYSLPSASLPTLTMDG